jgi:hypothetical protein
MYTEEQLVTFGNYLLKAYNVQIHSTDGKNQPLFQREVCHADVANWKTENPPSANWFPSQFNINDRVMFCIHQSSGPHPYPFNARILGVHFYAGKVKYDLEIPIDNEPPTRVYNIDSCFVLPITD